MLMRLKIERKKSDERKESRVKVNERERMSEREAPSWKVEQDKFVMSDLLIVCLILRFFVNTLGFNLYVILVLFVLHMLYRSVARIQMCKISNTITTCVTACFLRAISNILNAANATNPVITDRVFIKCNVFGLCLQLRNIFSFFPINYLPVWVDRNQIEDNLRKCLTTPHWKPLERESLPRFLNFYHLQTNESLSSTSNVGVKATI